MDEMYQMDTYTVWGRKEGAQLYTSLSQLHLNEIQITAK